MTAPIDILRRIVATTPCTCAGWPYERCLICQAGDALKVPVLTPEEGREDVKGATEEREACVKILAALTMAHPDICVSCSERAISVIRARGDAGR